MKPGGIVVGVHDPEHLEHLDVLLARTDEARRDIILVAVNTDGAPPRDDRDDDARHVVGAWENRVFTTAVACAEDAGRPVALMALRSDEPYGAVLRAAGCLRATCVVLGTGEGGVEAQARRIRRDWAELDDGRRARERRDRAGRSRGLTRGLDGDRPRPRHERGLVTPRPRRIRARAHGPAPATSPVHDAARCDAVGRGRSLLP